jgi:hypothetical protein
MVIDILSEPKPMFDSFVNSLGERFRQQYPQGSIISDLVQIHGDQYIVRVSVSSANTVLVSTLAADASLMVAENRGMERALTILGIRDAQQPAHEPVSLTVAPLPDLPKGLTNNVKQPSTAGAAVKNNLVSLPEPASPGGETVIPTLEPSKVLVTAPTESSEQSPPITSIPGLPQPDTKIPATSDKVVTDAAPAVMAVTVSEPEANEANMAKNNRLKKVATTPEPVPVVMTAETTLEENAVPIVEPPLSVTDMIPMINMELKRLGWSKERGREYMVSLYNKRASALLSDEELWGLLENLRGEE